MIMASPSKPKSGPKKVFVCALCFFECTTDTAFTGHLNLKHPRDLFFWCRWCGVLFSDRQKYVHHTTGSDCPRKYQFNHQCGFDNCKYSTGNPTRLLNHFSRGHKGASFIPCAYCKRSFTIPACLVEHIQLDCCERPPPGSYTRTENNKDDSDHESSDSGTQKAKSTPAAVGHAKSVPGVSGTQNANTPPRVVNVTSTINAPSEVAKTQTAKPPPTVQVHRTVNPPVNVSQIKSATVAAKRPVAIAKTKSPEVEIILSDSDPDDPSYSPIDDLPTKRRQSARLKTPTLRTLLKLRRSSTVERVSQHTVQKENASSTSTSTSSANTSNAKTSSANTSSAKTSSEVYHGVFNKRVRNMFLFCDGCGIICADESSKKEHMLKSCPKEFKFQHSCAFKGCRFSTGDPIRFIAHFPTSHTGEQFLPCATCNRSFSIPSCLVEHIQKECSAENINKQNNTNTSTTQEGSSTISTNPEKSVPAVAPNVTKTPMFDSDSEDMSCNYFDDFVSESPPASPETTTTDLGSSLGNITVGEPFSLAGVVPGGNFDSTPPASSSVVPASTSTHLIQLNNMVQEAPFSSVRIKKEGIENNCMLNVNDASILGDIGETITGDRVQSPSLITPTNLMTAGGRILAPPTGDSNVGEMITADRGQAPPNLLPASLLHNHANILVSAASAAILNRRLDSTVVETITSDKELPPQVTLTSQKSAPASNLPSSTVNHQAALRSSTTETITADILHTPERIVPTNMFVSTGSLHSTCQADVMTWKKWQRTMSCLKPANIMNKFLSADKIQHFYKCMVASCDFTSPERLLFSMHLSVKHMNQVLPCSYCFTTYSDPASLTEHLTTHHGRLNFQCSACLYRACSKEHVREHYTSVHSGQDVTIITCAMVTTQSFESCLDVVLHKTYNCTTYNCDFRTLVKVDFEKHWQKEHPESRFFSCGYCSFEATKLDTLIIHYTSHDVHDFECDYCSFGSDKLEVVVEHICINHANCKLQMLNRLPTNPRSCSSPQLLDKVSSTTNSFNFSSSTTVLEKSARTVSNRADSEFISSDPSLTSPIPMLAKVKEEPPDTDVEVITGDISKEPDLPLPSNIPSQTGPPCFSNIPSQIEPPPLSCNVPSQTEAPSSNVPSQTRLLPFSNVPSQSGQPSISIPSQTGPPLFSNVPNQTGPPPSTKVPSQTGSAPIGNVPGQTGSPPFGKVPSRTGTLPSCNVARQTGTPPPSNVRRQTELPPLPSSNVPRQTGLPPPPPSGNIPNQAKPQPSSKVSDRTEPLSRELNLDNSLAKNCFDVSDLINVLDNFREQLTSRTTAPEERSGQTATGSSGSQEKQDPPTVSYQQREKVTQSVQKGNVRSEEPKVLDVTSNRMERNPDNDGKSGESSNPEIPHKQIDKPSERVSESVITSYRCIRCDVKHKKRELAEEHARKVHKLDDLYKCPNCVFSCPDHFTLKNHAEVYHPNDPISYISLAFKKKKLKVSAGNQRISSSDVSPKDGTLEKVQVKIEVPDPDKPAESENLVRQKQVEVGLGRQSERSLPAKILGYRCKLCSFSCNNEFLNITRHLSFIHSAEATYKCLHCDYTSLISLSVKNHSKREHPEAEHAEPVSEMFSAVFADKESAIIQNSNEVLQPLEIITENISLASTSNPSSLQSTPRKASPKTRVAFPKTAQSVATLVCVFCNYTTSEKSHMATHLYMEMHYFKYLCVYCNFRGSFPMDVVNHCKRLHHDKPEDVGTKVNVKIESWVEGYIMAQSLEPKTEDDLIPCVLDKHYEGDYCNMCELKFLSKTDLRDHLYGHLNYRPHYCPDCDKAFITAPEVEYHQARQHPSNTKGSHYKGIKILEDWVETVIERNERFASNVPTENHGTMIESQNECLLDDNHKKNSLLVKEVHGAFSTESEDDSKKKGRREVVEENKLKGKRSDSPAATLLKQNQRKGSSSSPGSVSSVSCSGEKETPGRTIKSPNIPNVLPEMDRGHKGIHTKRKVGRPRSGNSDTGSIRSMCSPPPEIRERETRGESSFEGDNVKTHKKKRVRHRSESSESSSSIILCSAKPDARHTGKVKGSVQRASRDREVSHTDKGYKENKKKRRQLSGSPDSVVSSSSSHVQVLPKKGAEITKKRKTSHDFVTAHKAVKVEIPDEEENMKSNKRVKEGDMLESSNRELKTALKKTARKSFTKSSLLQSAASGSQKITSFFKTTARKSTTKPPQIKKTARKSLSHSFAMESAVHRNSESAPTPYTSRYGCPPKKLDLSSLYIMTKPPGSVVGVRLSAYYLQDLFKNELRVTLVDCRKSIWTFI